MGGGAFAGGYHAPMRPIVHFATVLCMGLGASLGMAAALLFGPQDQQLLLAVLREVHEQYVADVPRAQLVDDAIRGALAGLDDHSEFLDEAALLAMQENATGEFAGIGVKMRLVDGVATVTDLLGEDAPAARAGIVAGDRLVAVDGEPLRDRSLDDAAAKLRGEPGTGVHVRVRRDAEDAMLDFDILRAVIRLASVESRALAPGYGYAAIRRFNDTTVKDLRRAVAALGGEEALRGLVVDLRGNPGGLLETAVAVADEFLIDGVIVATRGRGQGGDRRFDATPGDLLNGAPLAVLVDRGSASASEVLAGALQDQGRAVVIGSQSYGKGSVQSVAYFQDRRAIKLTTARYYTPAGRSIEQTGVTPDIQVERGEGERRRDYRERLLAAALAHLRGAPESAGVSPAGERTSVEPSLTR